MAVVNVIMPQMGESIAEGTILKWHKKIGDRVRKDETLLEISTDKVDSEIPSPASGVLVQILVEEQKTVPVQTVIAAINTEGGGAADGNGAADAAALAAASTPKPAGSSIPTPPAAATPAATPTAPSPAPPAAPLQPPASGRFYSPLVLSIARVEGIGLSELEGIPGTGVEGRLSKKDLLAYVDARKRGLTSPALPLPGVPAGAAAGISGASRAGGNAVPGAVLGTPVDSPELLKKYPAPAYEVLKMSNVLQRMAHHMVQSVQTSPHVAAVHEVDMTRIVRHRAERGAEFERSEGFKLTFTPYIVDAVVRALKRFPYVNSSVEGDLIIRKNFINLGLAVASESGLIVPVIHHAEEMNFLGLARAVQDVASRTRLKKLTPNDISGGTFTITNYGVFGSTFGTPIINQPQAAILGTGAIKKRPVVTDDDAIAIRSIAYFTLSFDHRIIDGAMGGMFLAEVARNLEQIDFAQTF